MGWKDWPYWLRGGIIISSAVFTLFILSILPFYCLGIGLCIGIFSSISSFILLSFILGLFPNYGNFLISGIYLIIFYFLMGAIIGGLFGIFKNKVSEEYRKLIYKSMVISLIIGFILNFILVISGEAIGGLLKWILLVLLSFSGDFLIGGEIAIALFPVINPYFIPFIPLSITTYLILGAIIGLIYGKIKNRNSPIQQNQYPNYPIITKNLI